MHTEISQHRLTVHGSPRAGGSYTIQLIIADRVAPYLDEEVKARLTTYLVRSRRLGNHIPHIGQREVEDARVAQPSSVHERALSLLR